MYLFTMQVGITSKRHFPEFLKLLGEVSDQRKIPFYKVEKLLMAVVGMFLFRRGSLNHADNGGAKGNYSRNFERWFGCWLPDLDTSNSPLKVLEAKELKKIKCRMVQLLLRTKVLEKSKLLGAYYPIGPMP